ncbi:MAG TPA: hypothetical protein VJ914_11715 [Pseudonocardiaceae bacterium]|nr:hypothetical protein [Pseudonocardiaceae bacterium]
MLSFAAVAEVYFGAEDRGQSAVRPVVLCLAAAVAGLERHDDCRRR